MRHVHWLRFDVLETKNLMSTAPVAAAHAAPVVPVVIDGTLTVQASQASSTDNLDGSVTTSVPVSGRLGALGKCQGFWNDSVDEYGDYLGPDTLDLRFNNHYAKGVMEIEFNNVNTGKPHPMGHGLGDYSHAQRLEGGSGDFAKVSEKGSIEVIVNSAKGTIESLALITAVPSQTA